MEQPQEQQEQQIPQASGSEFYTKNIALETAIANQVPAAIEQKANAERVLTNVEQAQKQRQAIQAFQQAQQGQRGLVPQQVPQGGGLGGSLRLS